MMVNDDDLNGERTWQLVPGVSVEDATMHLLVDATPLLEEERYTAINALVTQSSSTGRSLGLGYPPAIVQSMRGYSGARKTVLFVYRNRNNPVQSRSPRGGCHGTVRISA